MSTTGASGWAVMKHPKSEFAPIANGSYGLCILVFALCGCSSSIHDAALRADLDQVEKVLASNPLLVNDRAGRGKTPLHQGVTSGSDEMVSLLLERGADPNAPDATGMTPLHVAASWTTTARAGLLVEAGSDLNARDSLGNTPLHEAALQGRGSMSYFLLKSGADPAFENVLGQTPLDLAESGGFDRIAALFRDWPPAT